MQRREMRGRKRVKDGGEKRNYENEEGVREATRSKVKQGENEGELEAREGETKEEKREVVKRERRRQGKGRIKSRGEGADEPINTFLHACSLSYLTHLPELPGEELICYIPGEYVTACLYVCL